MSYRHQNELQFGMVVTSKAEEVGYAVENVVGRNGNIATTFEEVWDQGGAYTFMSAAAPLYLSSSNSGDVQVVVATVLDANWNEVQITTTLTGQTAIVLTGGADYIRVQKIEIASAPAGDIYIAESDTYGTPGVPDTATKIHGKILAGNLRTQMAIVSVPVNQNGFVYEFCLNNPDVISGTADLLIREFGSDVWRLQHQLIASSTIFGGSVHKSWKFPRFAPPKSDIVIRMKSASSTISGDVNFESVRAPLTRS